MTSINKLITALRFGGFADFAIVLFPNSNLYGVERMFLFLAQKCLNCHGAIEVILIIEKDIIPIVVLIQR